MPWITIAAVAVLYVIAASLALHRRIARWELLLGWGCTVLAWGGLLLGGDGIISLDNYYAVIVLLISTGMMFAGWRLCPNPLRSQWNALSFIWGFLAGLLWLAVSYEFNLRTEFHVGLGILAGLLVASKLIFRLPNVAVLASNTVLLLLIGLPLADALTRPDYRIGYDAQEGKKFYSYEFARQNPAAFGRWWNHFVDEWRVLQKEICQPDATGLAPFKFRPGTEGMMFQSRVHINRLGFRGPEIELRKGDAFRIVALGESTTFGHTLNADDVPWPRLLERMIQEQLRPGRPVQVINAGIPSYTVRLNVGRLAAQIFPLKPDMIISYHGYNGFMWLNPSLPPSHGKGPPPYQERPLKVLADCEYRLKMISYRRDRLSGIRPAQLVAADPMETEYAKAYGDLFQAACTNGIQLVLANYSMAVNAQSDPDVVNFYRAAFPQVLSQIQANQLHSKIVAEMGRMHPEICLVNTHPGLDGNNEDFIDLVHFTQEGRQRIARTMFETIKPILQRELTARESTQARHISTKRH
jgi:lysophospholipase L1-like esterase